MLLFNLVIHQQLMHCSWGFYHLSSHLTLYNISIKHFLWTKYLLFLLQPDMTHIDKSPL